ncbi:short-chain dehydrogenase/reductase SDR [Planktomarina temperata RCA23]|uniref:Short-chain dehydrogenase/reductase SDR n=2 Tax=Paracoccaceae TaxID=31989 RepID=A0AAN0RJ66_9RHOB|nr:short-chain dehydrogenase/reductase SDR [Planktomarina temperata RCA23]
MSSNCFSDGLQNERLARGKGLHIGRQEDMFTPDQDRKEPQMREKFANYPSLSGKTVFVTGGASGIGAEIVTAFAKQGAKVGFVDMDVAGSEALLAKLEGTHGFAPCDLRDIEALKAAFAQLVEALGPAEILVNNAARDDRHDWREVTPEYWDERQNNNLRHMFFAIQAVADGMIAAGGGSIINMGSNSWWEAGGGFPAYTTAKAAVHGLTRTMARDLGDHRIRVNTVVPGWIMTERQKQLWVTPEALAKQIDRQCLPDPIDPVYVARMVLFLASDDSAACSAQNFMVEGGSI